MARRFDTVPDDVLYQVCTMTLREGRTVGAVTEWLKKNGYPSAKREWPRQMLVTAYAKGLLVLPGREHYELGLKIGANTNTVCRVAMVDDGEDAALDMVAKLAAEQALKLIRLVQETRKEGSVTGEKDGEEDTDKVHIGFSAGGTSHAFAYHLARMLEGQHNLPMLVLHSLTSGFFMDDPSAAPVVSLQQFSRIEPKPEYVVLFSSPVVARNEVENLRSQPFTKEAFDAARKIDIIVTSVAVADHEHNLFRYAIGQKDPENSESRLDRLRKLGWAGDIMWRPYSAAGEQLDCDIEPVSVVGFQDLVDRSSNKTSYVICIGGPCATCKETKKDALLPLLRCPAGRRPFSHLITTASTAKALCDELGW